MSDKKEILKRILSGHLSANAAASQLRQAASDKSSIIIVVSCADGLYKIGEDRYTEEQMRERVKNTVHVIVDEQSALLGDAVPMLIGGKDNTVKMLPDNGRD